MQSLIEYLQGKFCFFLFSFIIAGGVAFRLLNSPKPTWEEEVKVIETQIVKKIKITHEINLIGTIKPKRYCVLAAKTSGIIDTLIPASTTAKKGEVIAKIENANIEKVYELSLEAERIAKAQYDRVSSLTKGGASSSATLEEKQQQLIAAQKDLARATFERNNTIIAAPFDGTLGAYKVKDGAQVTQGEAVVNFYNSSEILVEFEIPSKYINKINKGQQVLINGFSYKLTQVQKIIDDETHMCPAYVELGNGKDCVIGDAVDVAVVLEEKSDALVIPYSAVFVENGRKAVYLVKEGKTYFQDVELGIRNKEQVEVVRGLNEYDELVTIAPERLRDDMVVTVAGERTDNAAKKDDTKTVAAEPANAEDATKTKCTEDGNAAKTSAGEAE
ncbi:MAG: efflux RND transporter periplasmic adaptor subunit [Holosporales bacterium]|nr:efflux RND transporter periplasmic adaptor subunit [Holosporales bacterium]